MKENFFYKYRLLNSLGIFLFIILGVGCQKPLAKNTAMTASSSTPIVSRPINALPLQLVTSSESNSENFVNTTVSLDEEDRNANTLLTTTTTYKNSRVGFQVTLPAGWYVPSEDNKDPHFYNCSGYDCEEGFEVQSFKIRKEENSVLKAPSYEESMKELREYEFEPIEVKNLVPNAKIIRALGPPASHGWEYQYNIFYSLKNQAFTILTHGKYVEKYILPTFKRL